MRDTEKLHCSFDKKFHKLTSRNLCWRSNEDKLSSTASRGTKWGNLLGVEIYIQEESGMFVAPLWERLTSALEGRTDDDYLLSLAFCDDLPCCGRVSCCWTAESRCQFASPLLFVEPSRGRVHHHHVVDRSSFTNTPSPQAQARDSSCHEQMVEEEETSGSRGKRSFVKG